MEDELLIAEDLKGKLRRLGHTVVGHAVTGEAAVQAVREEQPDVVLMDVRLRGTMSGLEAAQRIHEEYPVPVVFVTAHAAIVAKTMLGQPPPLMITKPFTAEQIASVIEEVCPAR